MSWGDVDGTLARIDAVDVCGLPGCTIQLGDGPSRYYCSMEHQAAWQELQADHEPPDATLNDVARAISEAVGRFSWTYEIDPAPARLAPPPTSLVSADQPDPVPLDTNSDDQR